MTNNAKWRNYETALLKVMGCDYSPYPQYWWWYRLLFIPSFAAPSCLIISGDEQLGELHFATLKEQYYDLFEAVYLSKSTHPEDAKIWRFRQCWEMMELLTTSEVQEFRQHLANIQPISLPDLKFMGRDGIMIRCWYEEKGKKHTFEMSNPSSVESPRYGLLLSASFKLLKYRINEYSWQQYLKENIIFF